MRYLFHRLQRQLDDRLQTITNMSGTMNLLGPLMFFFLRDTPEVRKQLRELLLEQGQKGN